MIGRDQRMNGMLIFCPREITVSNRQRSGGLGVIQSCANSTTGVSGCSSSAGFLEHPSATADKTVSGLHLPEV